LSDLAPRQHLAAIALVIDDYDVAVEYYTSVLGFVLVEDTLLSPGKRWVRVSPPASPQTQLLLARAATDEQRTRIGNQTGGRVFLFLHTNDFERDYALYRSRGVVFIREPSRESYGTVAVFEDRYGNRWDLIEPITPA
jgi:catechol 2,3-dioxygenase-like lactoylglutathione lyase family enzyme